MNFELVFSPTLLLSMYIFIYVCIHVRMCAFISIRGVFVRSLFSGLWGILLAIKLLKLYLSFYYTIIRVSSKCLFKCAVAGVETCSFVLFYHNCRYEIGIGSVDLGGVSLYLV